MKTKKELKNEYKNMSHGIGIFAIKNIDNDMMFVASSQNLDTVWNSQEFKLESGFHPNSQLQNDWKRLDHNMFQFIILKQVDETALSDSIVDIKYFLKQLLEETKSNLLSNGTKLY